MTVKERCRILTAALVLCLGGWSGSSWAVADETHPITGDLILEARSLVDQYRVEHPDQVPLMPLVGPPSQFASSPVPIVRCMPSSFNPATSQVQEYTWINFLGVPDRELIIWGRVDGGVPPYAYEWDFGDGVTTAGSVTTPEYIAVTHTYTTSGPKLARLTVTDDDGQVASREVRIDVTTYINDEQEQDVRVNAAIQDGLRWFYLHQGADGSWESYPPSTALAVAAFELNGHFPNNDPLTNIYAEFVLAGLEYLLGTLQTFGPIAAQTYCDLIDIDTNGNGVGIICAQETSAYTHGMVMLAIGVSRTPDAVAVNGGAGVAGETYRKILTDMVDQLAYSQTDGSAQRGGWRYSVATSSYGSDNSAVQWGSIGLAAAEAASSLFAIPVPQCLKDELDIWLQYSHTPSGGWGYTGPGSSNTARTGSALFSLLWEGRPLGDPLVQDAISYLDAVWCSGGQFEGNFYAMHAVTNPLENFEVPFPHDWYDGYVHHLVNGYTTPCGSDSYHQITDSSPPDLMNDGRWPSPTNWLSGTLPSSFALLILTRARCLCCTIICDNFVIVPDPALPESSVCFDAEPVRTTCPDREIVAWHWDFDDRDGVSFNPPDASGQFVCNEAGYALPAGEDSLWVTASLLAIDNGVPEPDSSMCQREFLIYLPQPCPVACLNGPFTACVGDTIFLDACCSYDPDSLTLGDYIVEYRWDLDGDGQVDYISDTCIPDTSLVFDVEVVQQIRLQVVDTFGCESDFAVGLAWSSLDELTVGLDDLVLDPFTECDSVGVCGTFHADLRPGGVLPEVEVHFYYDVIDAGHRMAAFTALNVTEDDSRTFCFTWARPDSLEHEIYFLVDPGQLVRECVETDNMAHKTLAGCDQCLEVTTGEPDEILPGRWRVPIVAVDPLRPGDPSIFAYQLELSFDPAVLDINDFTLNGTIVEGLTILYEDFNLLGPGQVSFALATTQPIPIPGVLVYLLADADGRGHCGDCGDCTDLAFDRFMYNEGEPCVDAVDGEFCFPYNTIAGAVEYFTCDALDPDPENPRPIPDVTLTLSETCNGDPATYEATTDSAGAYTFAVACAGCEYELVPSKQKLLDGVDFINSWDAQLVLAHVVRTNELDLCPVEAQGYDPTGLGGDMVYCEPGPDFAIGFQEGLGWPGDPGDYEVWPQRVTGEVSGNGEITAFDSSLILRYAIGDSVGLASRAGDWHFLCEQKLLELEADIAGSDFVGFLIGDVSGNWESSTPLIPTVPSVIALDAVPGDQTLVVVLSVEGSSELLALDAELRVDNDKLEFLSARPIGEASEFLVEARADGDRVRLAMAGLTGPTDGAFVELEFTNLQGQGVGQVVLPELVWTRINDGAVRQSATTSVSDEKPWYVTRAAPALVSIRPNPFNPSTTIEYYLPSSTTARLEVYDVTGRHVRMLVNGQREAGVHEVLWDGCDDRGRPQASGLYFAQLIADRTRKTSKMLLLK